MMVHLVLSTWYLRCRCASLAFLVLLPSFLLLFVACTFVVRCDFVISSFRLGLRCAAQRLQQVRLLVPGSQLHVVHVVANSVISLPYFCSIGKVNLNYLYLFTGRGIGFSFSFLKELRLLLSMYLWKQDSHLLRRLLFRSGFRRLLFSTLLRTV